MTSLDAVLDAVQRAIVRMTRTLFFVSLLLLATHVWLSFSLSLNLTRAQPPPRATPIPCDCGAVLTLDRLVIRGHA